MTSQRITLQAVEMDKAAYECLPSTETEQLLNNFVIFSTPTSHRVFRISRGLSRYSPMSEVFAPRYLAGLVSTHG